MAHYKSFNQSSMELVLLVLHVSFCLLKCAIFFFIIYTGILYSVSFLLTAKIFGFMSLKEVLLNIKV
jgi:hypothetical protein